MDWSVFSGIATSVALGALAFFIANIFNDFIKRKYMILGLKNESKQNIERVEYFKDFLKDFPEVLKLNPKRLPELLFKIDNTVYKNYYNDLRLLIDEKIVNKIIELYSMEYTLDSFKEIIQMYVIDDFEEDEKMKEEIEKIKNVNKLEQNYNKLKKIADEADKHLPRMAEIMESFSDRFIDASKKIIDSLEQLNKINFYRFFIRYFKQYIRKKQV